MTAKYTIIMPHKCFKIDLCDPSIHYVCPHYVFDPGSHFSSLVVKLKVCLWEDNTQSRLWFDGVLQFLCLVCDEVCQSSFKFVCAVKVKHAREDALVVRVDSVDSIRVCPKVVAGEILAESESSVEAFQAPLVVKCFHPQWDVRFKAFPEKTCELGVVRHVPVVVAIVVHIAVLAGVLVASGFREADYGLAFLWG